jgi:hypothetical protein
MRDLRQQPHAKDTAQSLPVGEEHSTHNQICRMFPSPTHRFVSITRLRATRVSTARGWSAYPRRYAGHRPVICVRQIARTGWCVFLLGRRNPLPLLYTCILVGRLSFFAGSLERSMGLISQTMSTNITEPYCIYASCCITTLYTR